MIDKYDEMAEKLLPCDCDCPGPGHWNCAAIYRPAHAAALREMGERDIVRQTAIANLHSVIREKDAEIERLKNELCVIGDMAVVDFDDAVVGLVDHAVPTPPKTYAEKRQAELAQVERLKAEIERLKNEIESFYRGYRGGFP